MKAIGSTLLLAVLAAIAATATEAQTLRTDLSKRLVPLEEIISGGPRLTTSPLSTGPPSSSPPAPRRG